MPTPLVTIAMPCLDEARFIEACLRSVQAQTYPSDRLEILVADGGSTDGTRDVLARLAHQDARIRVIDNPDRVQAAGLNRILGEARGDVVVRMDVHCEYAPDYVEKCVEALERTGADDVGGAQRCLGRTPFEKAVCAALRSPLGVGGAAYRSADNEGFVDTVFLGAYKRSVFDRIGPWDPRAVTNEDAELNQRLVDAGGRIYLSRDIVVHYVPRGSLAAIARQYYRYGRGRARTLLKHRRFLTDPAGPAVPGGSRRPRARGRAALDERGALRSRGFGNGRGSRGHARRIEWRTGPRGARRGHPADDRPLPRPRLRRGAPALRLPRRTGHKRKRPGPEERGSAWRTRRRKHGRDASSGPSPTSSVGPPGCPTRRRAS